MNMDIIVSRVKHAGGLFAYRRKTMSILAACVGMALAGCATDMSLDPNVTPKKVVAAIAMEAEIDKEIEKGKERRRAEERKKLAADVDADINKIVGTPTCYSGDVRDLDGLAEKIGSYEAGAPQVLSLSGTTETWRRAYGTGGGGGGGC